MIRKIILASCALTVMACNTAEKKEMQKEMQKTTETSENQKEKEPANPEATEVWEPVPAKVTPGENHAPPSDAIVLFDGSDLNAWESLKEEGQPAPWELNEDGSMTVIDKSGDIKTKENFGDIQLHIEWRNPETPRANGQNRGNSGIFLQGKYELQVLDTYDNSTYVNGQAGAIYKQHPPLVNASYPSGEWQRYDIIYHAPKWDENGEKIKAADITVLLNGILIQDHAIIKGTTEYIGWPKDIPHGDGPLILQDHNDNSGVSYRNIWVRKL